MGLGFDLKLGAIFVMFGASMLGAIPILYYSRLSSVSELRTNPIFLSVKCFATGVVLGVAAMHLINESIHALEDVTDFGALALCIVMIGFSFTLGIEQLAMHVMHASDDCTLPAPPPCKECDSAIVIDHDHGRGGSAGDHTHSGSAHGDHSHDCSGHSDHNKCGHDAIITPGHDHSHEHKNIEHGHDHAHSTDVTGCSHSVVVTAVDANKSVELTDVSVEQSVVKKSPHGHSHSIQMTAGTTRANILTKVYILLVAIVTHTVIIGFEYGTLHEDDDINTLKILLAAFSVHQLFEGITVGFFIASVYDVVGMANVIYLTLLFALSFPVGVILGKYCADESEQAETVRGVAGALAGGILIYSGTIEMVAEDFSMAELVHRPLTKLSMYIFYLLGLAGMAILAIWA